jgi:hypothetical protein
MHYLSKKKVGSICILAILLISNAWLICPFLMTPTLNSKNDEHEKINPISQDIDENNAYEGIGGSWNITHWANRTDRDLSISFAEGSYDEQSIPLGSGWIGNQLIADVYDLSDTRNWNNGSFHYGADDGNAAAGSNDSDWIDNSFQNWTFQVNDTGLGTNPMSGNYRSSINGHDCLELRMDDDTTVLPGWATYDPYDRCWWESSITVPRGVILGSTLTFDLYPNHLAGFNSWAFAIYLNNKKVYSIGTYTLRQYGNAAWHSFSIPQDIWINSSNVFPGGSLMSNPISIKLALECVGGGNYSGFTNQDYQQFYVDNVALVVQSQTLPSYLDLRVNQTVVDDVSWGTGQVIINGTWQSTPIVANFSSNDVGLLGTYAVELSTNLNLFAKKNSPDTNYNTNTGSLGTNFMVEHNANVVWEAFGFIAVPTGYVETSMRLEFPEDVVITDVYTPVEPSVNVLSQCDDSSPGILNIPIDSIISTPDGFWKFQALSPNYCEDIKLYNNKSGNWEESSTYLSGEYLNITASITDNALISNYLDSTKAELRIRFPNGSIWKNQYQAIMLNTDGRVQFNAIQIPQGPPDYHVGTYLAIVSWNNSHTSFDMNESGIIIKPFEVVHNSRLTSEQDSYENIIEGTVLNLKVSFNDLVNLEAIENALVYTYNFTHPEVIQVFNEVSPGYYLLEFNTTGAEAGNNQITVYANSTSYQNIQANITLDVTKPTVLSVESTFLQGVPYKSNFTISFNYTERYGGEGIHTDELMTDWQGTYHFSEVAVGNYELICNASGPTYNPGKLYTMIIDVRANNYIPQSIPIRVLINELQSQIELYINESRVLNDQLVSYEVWQLLNVTVKYYDASLQHLSGATIQANVGTLSEKLSEDPTHQQYSKVINATDIGQGIHYLSIFANKTFYNPQSIRAVLQITERLTSLQIFINGENKTIDPTSTIVIGSILNITISYRDSSNNLITGAIVQLVGDYSGFLIENPSLQQYSLLINSTNLGLGVSLITVSAQKTDLQFQAEDLRIEVRKIQTSITLKSGEPTILTRPGQSVTLEVQLNDLDNGIPIIGAQVSCSYDFGIHTGILIDHGDGNYTITLENVPLGSHEVTIIAFAGENYDFQTFRVTISAVIPIQELLMIIFLIAIALVVTLALGIYYYFYRTVFRFPKQVRHVRKFRKTIDKARAPRIDTVNRKDAFSQAFKEEVENTSKLTKAKTPSGLEKPDKFLEKIEEPKDLV